jgi:hypothetical protein
VVMYLRRVRDVGRSFSASAPALTHVCTVGDYDTKPRCRLGDGAHCPSTARHAAFNDHIFPKFRTSKIFDWVNWQSPVTSQSDRTHFVLA